MQKINLRELYPDVYKTDVFVNVAEEVVAAIRGQEQDDAAYERRKFRHKHQISTGKLEGFNNKIKVAKRIGYGYRNDDHFFTLIKFLSISRAKNPSPRKK